jgi:hypothetical protein
MKLFTKAKKQAAFAALSVTVIAGTALALTIGGSGPASVQSNLPNATYDHVMKVQAGSNKHLFVAVPGNFSSAHGCPSPWWAVSRYPFDDPQTQAMLQISLSSLLSRMPVHVWTEGCNSGGYPIITQMQVQEREPAQPPQSTPPKPSADPNAPGCVVPDGGRCCGMIVNGRCQGQCVGKDQHCE